MKHCSIELMWLTNLEEATVFSVFMPYGRVFIVF